MQIQAVHEYRSSYAAFGLLLLFLRASLFLPKYSLNTLNTILAKFRLSKTIQFRLSKTIQLSIAVISCAKFHFSVKMISLGLFCTKNYLQSFG